MQGCRVCFKYVPNVPHKLSLVGCNPNAFHVRNTFSQGFHVKVSKKTHETQSEGSNSVAQLLGESRQESQERMQHVGRKAFRKEWFLYNSLWSKPLLAVPFYVYVYVYFYYYDSCYSPAAPLLLLSSAALLLPVLLLLLLLLLLPLPLPPPPPPPPPRLLLLLLLLLLGGTRRY